jgi:hypothetical protein
MSQTGQSESKLVKRGARARASQGGDLFEREAREVAGPHEAHHLLEVLDEAAAHVDLRNLSVVEIGSSRSNLVELVKLGGIGQTGPRLRGPAIGLVLRGWAVLRACAHSLHSPIARSESSSQQTPPSPPLRTKWTRRVPHPVLIGHATNKPQRRCVEAHLEIDAHTGLVRLRDLRRRRPGGEEHVHAHQRVWLHRPDRSAALQLFWDVQCTGRVRYNWVVARVRYNWVVARAWIVSTRNAVSEVCWSEKASSAVGERSCKLDVTVNSRGISASLRMMKERCE